MKLPQNAILSRAKRCLWVLAIAGNAVTSAWFGDVLGALDPQSKLDEVATATAVQGSKLYRFNSLGDSAIAEHASIIVERFASQPGYEFLNDSQIDIIPQVSRSQITVKISHQWPTRFVRFFGFPKWTLQSGVSVQMKFDKTIEMPMV